MSALACAPAGLVIATSKAVQDISVVRETLAPARVRHASTLAMLSALATTLICSTLIALLVPARMQQTAGCTSCLIRRPLRPLPEHPWLGLLPPLVPHRQLPLHDLTPHTNTHPTARHCTLYLIAADAQQPRTSLQPGAARARRLKSQIHSERAQSGSKDESPRRVDRGRRRRREASSHEPRTPRSLAARRHSRWRQRS